MKNIHLIPTDKPSKLQKTKHDNFFLSFRVDLFTDCTSQHIYITNDDEIKKGDWYYDINDNESLFPIYQRSQDPKFYSGCKKIILTTDLYLIKNGVQAIDNAFLEWFAKNRSCERVSIKEEDYSQKCRECGETVKRGYNCAKGCFMKSGNFIPTDKNINYKIIIPKEEPKQEPCDNCNNDVCCCIIRKQETNTIFN
jgi:hypothetical protein